MYLVTFHRGVPQSNSLIKWHYVSQYLDPKNFVLKGSVTSAVGSVLHPDHMTQEVMSSQRLTAGTVLQPAPSSRTVSASHRPISVCAAHTDSRNMEFILLITAVSVRLVLHDNRAHTGSAGPGRAQPADLWTLRPLKKGLQSRNKAHTVPVWMFLWGSTPTG